jgi:dTDP-4-dehydrorhamnose 3,5-epimerase
MGKATLDDILVTKLNRIEIIKGNVMHALKAGEAGFAGFGEAYFSLIEKNEIKAWKLHKQMVMNLIVPIGNVKFVFFRMDQNNKKIFRVESIGELNYCRLTVPPGIWFGFQGLSEPVNLILNVSNIVHDAEEQEKIELKDLIYDWQSKS